MRSLIALSNGPADWERSIKLWVSNKGIGSSQVPVWWLKQTELSIAERSMTVSVEITLPGRSGSGAAVASSRV